MMETFLFEKLDCHQISYQIVYKNNRPSIKSIPKSYQDLIKRCWSEDINVRPTFEQIIEELRMNEGFITDKIDKETYYEYVKNTDEHFSKLKSQK